MIDSFFVISTSATLYLVSGAVTALLYAVVVVFGALDFESSSLLFIALAFFSIFRRLK